MCLNERKQLKLTGLYQGFAIKTTPFVVELGSETNSVDAGSMNHQREAQSLRSPKSSAPKRSTRKPA